MYRQIQLCAKRCISRKRLFGGKSGKRQLQATDINSPVGGSPVATVCESPVLRHELDRFD